MGFGMIKKKINILCVDDEQLILNALTALLRLRYNVITTTNAREAVEILKSTDISVVISDQRMPEMLGTDFLKIAKKVSPHTTRILLTGFSDLGAIISTVNDSEVYRFLTKPWSNAEVLSIVRDAVEVSKVLKETNATIEPKKDLFDTTLLNAEVGQHWGDSYIIYKSTVSSSEFDIATETPDSVKVLTARTNAEVLKLLTDYPVKLIVTYSPFSNEDDIELLKYLKRELPELLSIGLVRHADYEDIITLINEAKLYRYVVMPSKPGQVAHFINSAINMFHRFSQTPTLLQNQKVMEKTPIKESLLGILGGVKRFFRFN